MPRGVELRPSAPQRQLAPPPSPQARPAPPQAPVRTKESVPQAPVRNASPPPAPKPEQVVETRGKRVNTTA